MRKLFLRGQVSCQMPFSWGVAELGVSPMELAPEPEVLLTVMLSPRGVFMTAPVPTVQPHAGIWSYIPMSLQILFGVLPKDQIQTVCMLYTYCKPNSKQNMVGFLFHELIVSIYLLPNSFLGCTQWVCYFWLQYSPLMIGTGWLFPGQSLLSNLWVNVTIWSNHFQNFRRG